jgi:hypothetical protein
MDNTVLAGGTSAILVSVLLQALKRSGKVTWITRDTGKLNAVLGAIGAGLTAAGVRYLFDYDDATGNVVMSVTFNVGTVLEWAQQSVGQWGVQQRFFWAAIKPGELLADILREMKARNELDRYRGV